MSFFIDGKSISYNDTPDSLQLEDNCQIIAKRVITIKVKDKEDEVNYRINTDTKMANVFSSFASKRGVDESSLRFLLDGEIISPTDTPLTLDLNDGDQIDVKTIFYLDSDSASSIDSSCGTDEIIVEGCGIDEINGVYKRQGSNDDVPKYVHSGRYNGNDEEFTLFRCKLMDELR